jgi:membrane-associated protease RseP (regulator of RpoE activity)
MDQLLALVGRYVIVDGYFTRGDEISVRGTVVDPPENWRSRLLAEAKMAGYAVRVRQNDTIVHLNLHPSTRRIPWLNVILFAATAVSVSVVPAIWSEAMKVLSNMPPESVSTFQALKSGAARVFSSPEILLYWQRFAIPLLLILLFHEFGHYLAARRRGIRTSLPYFIPAPTLIGTFGAFIKSNSPFPSRRDLLEVGAYGPIAGFVVAVIFLVIGLSDVTYHFRPPGLAMGSLSEPLIMRIVEFFVTAKTVPSNYDIFLQDNPTLFAAWVGLIVTMLNLLPAGQLDGGHIIYALSPRAHRWVSRGVFVALLGLGFIWDGWWIWAMLLFFVIKFHHPPTLDDDRPLAARSRWTGWAAIAIFLLTFSPIPF